MYVSNHECIQPPYIQDLNRETTRSEEKKALQVEWIKKPAYLIGWNYRDAAISTYGGLLVFHGLQAGP